MASRPHSVRPQIALNTLKALLDMERSERVMAIVEDPSLLDFVGDLLEQLAASERRADVAVEERQRWEAETHRLEEQLVKLESLERQAWWKADHENRRAQSLEEQFEAQREAVRAYLYGPAFGGMDDDREAILALLSNPTSECPTCSGLGRMYPEKKGDYRPVADIGCPDCGGLGRVASSPASRQDS